MPNSTKKMANWAKRGGPNGPNWRGKGLKVVCIVEASARRKEWSHAVWRRLRRGGSGRMRYGGVGGEEGVVGVSDEEGWFSRVAEVPATTREWSRALGGTPTTS